MSEEFNARYEVDDGYAGGSRPQYVDISSEDLEDDMSDDDILQLYDDLIQNDFEQNISWFSKTRDEFLEWAKEQLASRAAAEKE